jgi:membrane protein implicated in regulation of membrane protease activity
VSPEEEEVRDLINEWYPKRSMKVILVDLLSTVFFFGCIIIAGSLGMPWWMLVIIAFIVIVILAVLFALFDRWVEPYERERKHHDER